YDPMIAKLITWGADREQARQRMMDALDSFDIRGVTTNIVFLNALVSHPAFASGAISTGFIGEEYPEGFSGDGGSAEQQELFAVIAGYLRAEARLRATHVHASDADSPWKMLKRTGSGN
ncbi:MAG TPA: acetyl/propionyl-CoA carboxylase subunit alpha, partial [Gammaproteobacteria bacterium]|nr:acetyl/propionyl-CoA carboxylase subunit alpha [Gammaproteobacteria bacterium]